MQMERSIFACLLTFLLLTSGFTGVYAQDSAVLLAETFDNGSTALSLRLNKAGGTQTEATGAVSNGVLTLRREAGDGLQLATGLFPVQTEGKLVLSLDVKSDLQTGRLFALSSQPFEEVISLRMENGALALVANDKSVPAGSLAADDWYSLELTLDVAAHTAVLVVNGVETARLAGIVPSAISVFEMALTDHNGYLSADNIYLRNTEKQSEQFADIIGSDAESSIRAVAEKGIMTGMDDGTFSPDTCLTRAQMAQIVTRTLNLQSEGFVAEYSDVQSGDWFYEPVNAITRAGIMVGFEGKFYPNDLLTFEEVAKILVNSAGYGGAKEVLTGLTETFDLTYVGKTLTDEDAVAFDAESLQLEQGGMIYDNLTLPTQGDFGSIITWQSTSDAVDSQGRIKRPSGEPVDVELTATITKGDIGTTKRFSISVMPCDVNWVTTPAGSSDSELLVKQIGDNINITYDVTPKGYPLNTVMGFSSAEAMATAFTQMPVIVRFNEEGYIDAYNGSNFYMADTKVEYVEGTSYTIRLSINLSTKTYSVWVKPAGRAETQIAEKYLFRASADVTENIGKFYIKAGGTVSGDVLVTCMSVAAPEEVIGAERYTYSTSDGGSGDSALDGIRATRMVTESLTLPTQDTKGRQIIWVSSDASLFNDSGALVNPASDNISFRMTAVTADGSTAAYGLISQKAAISDWAFGYIASAVNMGLVQDVLLTESFTSKMSVTRGYAAVLVERLLNILS